MPTRAKSVAVARNHVCALRDSNGAGNKSLSALRGRLSDAPVDSSRIFDGRIVPAEGVDFFLYRAYEGDSPGISRAHPSCSDPSAGNGAVEDIELLGAS